MTLIGSGGLPFPVVSKRLAAATAVADILAIWVPANEKKRKRKVPTNSPRMATMLLRTVEGRESMGREFWTPSWATLVVVVVVADFLPPAAEEGKRRVVGLMVVFFDGVEAFGEKY